MDSTPHSRSWYGWLGAALILSAYLMVSVETISARGAAFQLLNLLGSAGIVVSAAAKRDWPPLALNLVWSVVALVVLIGLLVR